MYPWLVAVPWIWTGILVITAITNLASMPKMLRNVYRIGAKEVLTVGTYILFVYVKLKVSNRSFYEKSVHKMFCSQLKIGHSTK